MGENSRQEMFTVTDQSDADEDVYVLIKMEPMRALDAPWWLVYVNSSLPC